MPTQLTALVNQLNAKRASFASIRHSPGFGIAAKIMRSESGEAEFACVLFSYVPDYPFSHTVAPVFAGPTDTSKHSGRRDKPAAVVQARYAAQKKSD
jgi:hypothetical protein